MSPSKQWSVDILIEESDGRTRAEARLTAGDVFGMKGVGWAQLNPADDDVPEIGDELAVARAMSDLGHRLLIEAASEMEDPGENRIRIVR
ncbi:hypothetical protein Lfu02_71240 [Longispora fulva]|uniref:CRP-like cAMP-binding protein n=1 Tax=Longispora fulva TaxID=619741 RepID=A0A8J7KTY4_9ACTN|nr:DUF1876 domain-containing protein [Longispora fulva]MBG6141252.1 CRP-like cAMP-binding protein [Longispora fulva]GIG62752.1 hypothetical protein Lfu02_71240 [Longispora fulva]